VGSKYRATCKACHHNFELIKGGGWSWYQKVCNACGICTKIPRNGPSWFVGNQMSAEDMARHLATPEEWSRSGGRFDRAEKEMLNAMTAICICGGEMIPEWDSSSKHRCPECRSGDLELNDEILFD